MSVIKETIKGVFGGKPKVETPPLVPQKKITSDSEGIANKTIADARRRNRGYLSTIATSPTGLGSDDTISTKTLLG